MKKLTRLLPCLLLSAVLAIAIFTSLPTQAQAVDNSPISSRFAAGTTEAECPVCKEVVTWKELTATKTSPKDGEHYYLAENLRWVESTPLFYFPQTAGAEACLHLNGKTITSVEARVFDGGKGILNIMGNGTVSSGKSGVGAILSTWGGETANIYGGTYRTTGSGNAIYVVGTVNIYDPVIIDASSARGGTLASCIYTEREEAVINLHGGQLIGTEITGNGGTVTVGKGTFNMSGGVIEGGSVSGVGGNVQLYSGGTFTMSGGTIKGGKSASSSGNIHVNNGTFKLSGGTIEGGTAKNGGNMCIYKTDKITISGGTIKDGKAEGAGGNFYLSESAGMKISGGTISGGTAASGGNFSLSSASLTMTAGTVQGGTATQGGNFNCAAESKLTLSGGTISGGTSEKYGGNICQSAGTLTISGAKITGGVANHDSTGGGNLYVTTDASVKMTSGTIDRGTAKHGGNIYIYKGKMNMSGGKIEGGTATGTKGGSIYLYGWEEFKCILNISGGKLEGGDLYIAGPDARISVSDGTVLSKIEGKTENLQLSGGTVSQPLEDTLQEGMGMFEAEDGSFILYDEDSVAMVGKDMFKNLADALKKATLDNKLILLADVSSELVISGKKAIDLNGHTVSSMRVEDKGQLKLYNHKQGKIENLTAPMGQVTLESGQYSTTVVNLTNTGTWNIENGIYADITNKGKLTILAGEFTGKLEGSDISVNGGVFGHDVTALLTGEYWLCPIDGGRFIACDPSAAAAVDGKVFTTLQAALDSDPFGKGVYLLRDCDEQAKYEAKGKNNITLMTNGFTLKELTVGAGANLNVNVTGGGKVTTLHQYVRVHAQDNNYAVAFDVIYNHIDLAYANGIFCEIRNEATLTISGGQFNGPVSGGKLEITGGEFTGGLGTCESIAITGGTFANDVSQWVSEGYVCQKSGNGYTVGVPAPFNPVPYILIGGGVLLLVIVVVAILLTRPSKKEQSPEKEKEEA